MRNGKRSSGSSSLNNIVKNVQRSIKMMKTPGKRKESMILLKDRWLATKEISNILKRLKIGYIRNYITFPSANSLWTNRGGGSWRHITTDGRLIPTTTMSHLFTEQWMSHLFAQLSLGRSRDGLVQRFPLLFYNYFGMKGGCLIGDPTIEVQLYMT